jgi:hypothetical protein
MVVVQCLGFAGPAGSQRRLAAGLPSDFGAAAGPAAMFVLLARRRRPARPGRRGCRSLPCAWRPASTSAGAGPGGTGGFGSAARGGGAPAGRTAPPFCNSSARRQPAPLTAWQARTRGGRCPPCGAPPAGRRPWRAWQPAPILVEQRRPVGGGRFDGCCAPRRPLARRARPAGPLAGCAAAGCFWAGCWRELPQGGPPARTCELLPAPASARRAPQRGVASKHGGTGMAV